MEAYIKNHDTAYINASCYESLMRFPTDVKLLWESVEKTFKQLYTLGIITRVYRQQKNNFRSGNSRESILKRIGTKLKLCVSLSAKLTGVPMKKLVGDQGYSGTQIKYELKTIPT